MSNLQTGPDILAEPLFSVADPIGETERLDLPALLIRLLTGPEVERFPRIQAEQRGHWWRFLVRCAAKSLRMRGWSLDQLGQRSSGDLAAALRDTLREAAADPDGTHGAWWLHQPDPCRAGFLQPPTPGGATPGAAQYAHKSMSLLTSAIGSKHHERKVDVAREMDAEQSVYALVEFQFGAVYGGPGKYGSQIMGSALGAGSGSPFMGVRLGPGENETFRHDVTVLLESWDRVREDHALRGNVWALWTLPWNGDSSLPSNRLDPAFIPLARLVRLDAPRAGTFHTVWFCASSKARVEDLTGGGNLGDPFTPRVPDAKNPEIRKVRGTLARGYGYAEVTNLLFGTDSKRPGTASPSVLAARTALLNGRADVRVLFEGTAFEQGKTLGFYSREVMLPPSSAAWLSQDPALSIRQVSAELLTRVRDVKAALNGAARILASGDPKPHDGDAGKINLPSSHFDALVDGVYLDALLNAAGRHVQGDDTWHGEWARLLAELALESFHETRGSVPTATARRYEREVRATAWLQRRLRRARADAGDPEAFYPSTEPREVSP
jgi:CRISPR system Cascade subunit CasA